MRLFGLEIGRKKEVGGLTAAGGDRGNWWFPIIREPYTGAWQRNREITADTMLTYHAVYACIERIASDVAKCGIKLMKENEDGTETEVAPAAFAPVLRRPNGYQNRIQFIENWVVSKLVHGNAYILKGRDNRNVVTEMHVLDPLRVKTLVAPNGDIYYDLGADNLSGVGENPTVPANEIMHDMMTMKYHPLCGIPPMAPAALAAQHGLNIQRASAAFFLNQSMPSGLLIAPGQINETQATRVKERFQQAFSGGNVGKIALVGDGMKFEPLTFKAVDTQLIEQLAISAKMVCSSFGVPAHMVGVGDPPAYNNIEALNQQYYSQCLQKFIEAIELLLDEGLGLADAGYEAEFELDDLLRMDTATMISALGNGVGAGIIAPNEARAKLGYGPAEGGQSPYLQQQNYSLAALNKRDTQADPFAPVSPQGAPTPTPPSAEGDAVTSAAMRQLAGWELQAEFERLAA